MELDGVVLTMPRISVSAAAEPIGGFLAMTLDSAVCLFTRRLHVREFLEQTKFVAGVSTMPSILVMIPFAGFVVFILNQLLGQIGAVDLAGTGAAFAVTREVGPIASVLVVSGAGATAICADLGARTIREELDAMRVLGIDPIHRLVVPRILASGLVALVLDAVVSVVGLATGYMFSVVVQGGSAGQYMASMTLLTGLPELALSGIKSLVYGLAAGMVACYKGLSVGGGPKAVGEAVNQTVILSLVVLFVFNTVASAAFTQLGIGTS
ncbi:MAG TPA: ABC transporter permease [Pseudonocardiaceae bacterium]|jgi:phospholipid/cholesterol/gamma-HCH transport system permease protein|nr:ABC transporter permease [Pseudonocardiaceae bacterium]